ncbi:DUF922 domain-containing protein [Pseudomonas baetica]|uniref:DUF922 domain-containing protein n=1 Tax=Pseudomonas baetica TaxID=674054 RepID=UPI0024057AEB|nr:DUF922 domain-containing protein [Pseudomonas baetica]MDF9779235.1 putative secreted Zn-dependent protease [Pseudomonas baetica]
MSERDRDTRPLVKKLTLLAAAALILGLLSNCASAETSRPKVTFQISYYPVFGRSIAEISNSIGQNTPSKDGDVYYAGVTVWDLNSSFDMVSTPAGCSLANSQVYLNTTIHLPQLAAPGQVSDGVRNEWTRFSNALKTHEMMHAKNAYRAASTLLGKINNLTTSVQCDRARIIIQDGTDALIKRITEFDRDLDNETEHGRTQGAFLNLGIR